MPRQRIAVVGSGISGLASAWLLSTSHDVTLFERDERVGGHANTVEVAEGTARVAIDTGFIVYNTGCYPNLLALFDHLGVATAATRMGFSVSLDGGRYEYSGTGLHGLFGQPSNLVNVAHWRMVRDIPRFFRDAEALQSNGTDEAMPLGVWLDQRGYSEAFRRLHILPMAAAIWSAPDDEVMGYPAAAFARFFANHGLLQVRNRPEWRTVAGGSRHYVQRLVAAISGRIVTEARVERIERTAGGVELHFRDGRREAFDQVVLATHADTALGLLAKPTVDERRHLSAFRYQPNRAVLHTDTAMLPRRKRLWSSWNYRGSQDQNRRGRERLCVSYYMNALQPLATTTDYIVTLNPPHDILPSHVKASFDYSHPMFDASAIAAQRTLWTLQGKNRTWFAGSYVGSGFHEDALQAGLWVGEQLGGVQRPWRVAGENDRLHCGPSVQDDLAEAAE